MSNDATALIERAIDLATDDRRRIVNVLCDNLDSDDDSLPFDPEWIDVIKQRIAKLRAGESKRYTWEEARQAARDSFERKARG